MAFKWTSVCSYEVREPAADYAGAGEVVGEAENKAQEGEEDASNKSLVAEGGQRMPGIK